MRSPGKRAEIEQSGGERRGREERREKKGEELGIKESVTSP